MKKTQLHLAPMEGVVDWVMRDMLTQIGGIDHCVTEFVRVIDQVYPDHVYYRYCPELKTNSRTRAGTPIFVQILGGQPEPMARNAQKLVELGAAGIDINFGCPAKTVNRHDGGAIILNSPQRIFDIVSAVRKAVPLDTPITTKIRLGYESPENCVEIAQAVEASGASWLTVHCRTKADGYKPPAHWHWVSKIREKVKIKIIANGDIDTVESFLKCQQETGCQDFMIGRGALSDPFIFKKIKVQEDKTQEKWDCLHQLICQFYETSTNYRNQNYAMTRTKQWLRSLAIKNEKAKWTFDRTKTIRNPDLFYKELILSL